MSASGAGLRRPGIAFCLAVLLAARFSHSAPVYDQDTTQVAELNAGGSTCYYNYKHYQEGDRIITNEPCLNCTCHNRMLMCYLRVCPFTKAIGQDCTVEKRPDQCCPVITCPEVPVQLLTSTTSAPSSGSTEVGFRDNYGCSVNNLFYADGAQLPIDYHNPCELCYCIRNRTTCVMQECTLNVAGCRPIYQPGVCCPVKYDCDYDEHAETTVGPTPGLIMTTTIAPGIAPQCFYDGKVYEDGELIPSTMACQHCYCFRGDIACAVQDCGTPMKTHGKNCTALPPPDGECCPTTYQCESDLENEVTSIPEIKDTMPEEGEYETTEKMISTTMPSKELEDRLKPETLHDSYPGADNTIPENLGTDEHVAEDLSPRTTEKSLSSPSFTERAEFTTMSGLSSEIDKEFSTQKTEVPEIEDRDETTEIQREITLEEFDSSTPSDTEKLTTVSDEESLHSTEKSETFTSMAETTQHESSTIKEEPVHSSTMSMLEETYETEKQNDSQYTTSSEKEETFPTGSTEIETSSEKSASIDTTVASDISEGKSEESSTFSEEFTQKSFTSKSPELESTVTEDTNKIVGDVTSKESQETTIEIEMSTPEAQVSKSDDEAVLSTELQEKGTEPSVSTESIIDSNTKIQDVEVTTAVTKEETTIKQAVTSSISDRIPEHKAEDKDAIPDIYMTEKSIDQENEVTSEISGTYLPPTSTVGERITVTESSEEFSDSTKDFGLTEKTENKMDDITTSHDLLDVTVQSETEKSDHSESSESFTTQQISTDAESTETPALVDQYTHESDVGMKQTTLPDTITVEPKIEEISTTSIKLDNTEEPGKEIETQSTTVEESKPHEKTTISTFETTTELKTDKGTDMTTKIPETFSTPVDEINENNITIENVENASSTGISNTDEIITTNIVENKEAEDKSEQPEIEDIEKSKPTTVIMTDIKETEKPSTDSLITEEPTEKHISSTETMTETKLEESSTSYSITTESTETYEVSSTLRSEIEVPTTQKLDENITSTKISATEQTESSIQTEGFTDQSSVSVETTESINDIVSKETKVTESSFDTSTSELTTVSFLENKSSSLIEPEGTTQFHDDLTTDQTESPGSDDHSEMMEVTPEILIDEEEKKLVTTSDQSETPKPSIEEDSVSPLAPKEETDTSQIPELFTSEVTKTLEEESSHVTESLETEKTSATPISPEIRPPMGIPGEGNCLVDGQSYSNNSAIPPANSCQIRCRCISSIVQCDLVQCAPPPGNSENCKPIHSNTDCCPIYSCGTTPDIESDNHMRENEPPSTDEGIVEVRIPEVGISESTSKIADEDTLVASSPSTEVTSGKDNNVTELEKDIPEKSVTELSSSTEGLEENVTSGLTEQPIEGTEEFVKEVAATKSTDSGETTIEAITEEISKEDVRTMPTDFGHTTIESITNEIPKEVVVTKSTDLGQTTVETITEGVTKIPSTEQTTVESIAVIETHGTTTKIDEESFISTTSQSEQPLDDKITTSSDEIFSMVTEGKTGESIETTSQFMTEKVSEISENVTESISIESTSVESFTTMEPKTPKQPEQEMPTVTYSSSDEVITETASTSEISSTLHSLEDKITLSDTITTQLDDESTPSSETDDKMTSEFYDKESTAISKEFTQTPLGEAVQSGSETTTYSSLKEETSSSGYDSKVTEESSYTSEATTFVDKDIHITSSDVDKQTTQIAEKIPDMSSTSSQTPTEITEKETSESDQVPLELTTVSDELTTSGEHITTEFEQETKVTSTEKHILDLTTVQDEDQTNEPLVDEDLPQSSHEPEDIPESTGKIEEPMEQTESSIESTEKPTQENEDKISEELTTVSSIESETTKSTDESHETTMDIEVEEPSTSIPEEKLQSTTTEHSETFTTEYIKQTTKVSTLEEESITSKEEMYSTLSTSEAPELSKEEVTTTEGTIVEVTESIKDEAEISEITTVHSSNEDIPEITEIPIAITKATLLDKSTETEQETYTTDEPIGTFEGEEQQTTTRRSEIISDYSTETPHEVAKITKAPEELPSERPLVTSSFETTFQPEEQSSSTNAPEVSKTTMTPDTEVTETISHIDTEITDKSTDFEGSQESTSKAPATSVDTINDTSEETIPEIEIHNQYNDTLPEVSSPPEDNKEHEGEPTVEQDDHENNHTTEDHSTSAAPEYPDQAIPDENPNFPINGGSYLNPDEDYDEEDQVVFGPGTCRYGGKVYMSAQQIPRDDPCDFCFCFRGDIICLQQSCPPPIPGCHEEPINGFCCPRYECPVSMATSVNITTTTTTTTTTVPPHFPSHAYKGAVKRSGCIVGGQAYRVGEIIKSASGPCRQCTCERDGDMSCEPQLCYPEPSYKQMIAAVTAKRRRR